MAIKFGDEHIGLGKKSGVYKIIFNEKWYYIGSSVNLMRRLSCWKHYLNSGKFTKNRSIGYLLPEIENVRFSFLEFVDKSIDPKVREDEYIKLCFDDEFCLNISRNAFRTKRDKKHIGYVQREKRKTNGRVPKKPIAQVDINGKILRTYLSITQAVTESGLGSSKILKMLKGKRGAYKGTSFKLINLDGSLLEPPKFFDKKRIGKLFYAIDKKDNIVGEYRSVIVAAKETGADRRNIENVLKNKYRHKTAGGFIFKYA